MAVAVKNTSEAAPAGVRDRLAITSLFGVLYVLGSIGVLFYGVPDVWNATIGESLRQSAGAFVEFTLELVVLLAAVAGLVVVGARLVGPTVPHGLRAGIGVGVLGLLGIGLVAWLFGKILEAVTTTDKSVLAPEVGLGLMGAVGLGLLYWLGRKFFRPDFEETLKAVEDQGWFTRAAYKPSQGQRVRRGTIVGIIGLIACGIITLLSHHTLDTLGYLANPTDARSFVNDWTITIPFTAGKQLTLLHHVRLSLPLLLVVGGLWFAYRVVNFPTFADFLIATEAELNKVSWTTRKRLWQDTIVVLTTLILFTIFLMVVDLFWGFVLSNIGVLEKLKPSTAQDQQVQPW